MFFRIIIPNYNNGKWLKKCVESVLSQSFTDYELIVVDDCSEDDSAKYLESIRDKALVFLCKEKHYNGGSRNIGINQFTGQSKYTLFLDSDDWFTNLDILKELHDFIVVNGQPDCIRLPYRFEYEQTKTGQVMLCDNTPEMLVHSCFVACWTKCIKSDLIQPFPENTLMEDVVQHIKQCDVISEVIPFNLPVVVHNKNNLNSITREGNTSTNKWQSSMFRYMADLMDLELEHDYCKNEREKRKSACFRNIKAGVYSQSIVK